jgi:hypothetical protein
MLKEAAIGAAEVPELADRVAGLPRAEEVEDDLVTKPYKESLLFCENKSGQETFSAFLFVTHHFFLPSENEKIFCDPLSLPVVYQYERR